MHVYVARQRGEDDVEGGHLRDRTNREPACWLHGFERNAVRVVVMAGAQCFHATSQHIGPPITHESMKPQVGALCCIVLSGIVALSLASVIPMSQSMRVDRQWKCGMKPAQGESIKSGRGVRSPRASRIV